jgi:VWFA-related protein
MRRALAFALIAALLPFPGGLPAATPDSGPQGTGANQGQNPPAPSKQEKPAPGNTRQDKKTGNPAPLRVFSDLVLIDAQVTDRAGKPLKGLKPDQFVVLEDGKPQFIISFDYYDVETVETAGSADAPRVMVTIGETAQSEEIRATLRDRRLLVLFFDLTSLQPPDLLRSRDAAARFLREQMTNADLVSVVSFGNRLKVVANFTNDRALLAKALDRLQPGKDTELSSVASASAQSGEVAVSEDTGDAFTPDETEFNVFNTDRKLAAMESLSQVLRDIPGRKAVISFTSGITQTGQENQSQLRATTDAANRGNVSFYTVDSRGLEAAPPGGDSSHAASSGTSLFSGDAVFRQAADRQNSRETLATLATDTGGRSFFDLGDFREAFQKAQQDSSGYYLIGYNSNNAKQDGRWRRVDVKVRTAGARIRSREGYFAPRKYGQFTAEDRERQLEQALQADTPQVELALALETAQFRVGKDEIFVPIAAKLSPAALDWAEHRGQRVAEFDFAAEVREQSSGRSVASLRDTVRVQLDPARFSEIRQRPLLYQGGIILGPGNYHLKFLVRENATGKIGTFEQPLRISAAQPDKLELSSLLLSSQVQAIGDSVSNRKEVQTKALAPGTKMRHSPLEVAGERIIPSVTRVFTAGQTLHALFQAYLPEKAQAGKLRAGLVFFREGARTGDTGLFLPAEIDAGSRSAVFRQSVSLADFAPGRYTVEVVVVEAGGAYAGFTRQTFALRAAVPADTSAPRPGPTP